MTGNRFVHGDDRSNHSSRFGSYTATASIATFSPGLAIPTFAVDLAGGSSGKNSL